MAERGEMELECEPFGYIIDADGRFLIIPAAILNIGVADGWELVVEARNFVHVSGTRDRIDTIRDSAISFKGLVRQGSLQDGRGHVEAR